MLNLYVNRIKCLIRAKECVFWTLLFPIILATLFHFAFSNLGKTEDLSGIPVAVVGNDESGREFISVMKQVKAEDGAPLFLVKECAKAEEARNLLHRDEVLGIVGLEKGSLTVKNSGLKETVIKVFLDQYGQTAASARSIAALNPGAFEQGLAERLVQEKSYLRQQTMKTEKSDFRVLYFYGLMAMACMFGMNWGIGEVISIEANRSSQGARLNLAPISKFKFIISHFLAALTLHVAEMMLLLFFLKFVLKIHFGTDTHFLALLFLVGGIAAISIGAVIAALIRGSSNIAASIAAAITMLGSFLAGLMIPEVKYFIDARLPVVSYINPAGLIADALYSLYYYDDLSRFTRNIFILSAYAAVFTVLTAVLLRRKRYAGI